MEYTGLEFNKINHDKIFIKIINHNFINHDFEYKPGLNQDILPFNPQGSCQPGGLYFCEFKYALNYQSCGNLISHIIIPGDARIYCETNKYKTNKLIILNLYKFWDHPFWSFNKICLESVKINGFSLLYIKSQTPEICLVAVKFCGLLLKYVLDQTPEICEAAIRQNPLAIRFVKNQTPYICCLAIQQNGLAYKYINNKTLELKYLSEEKYKLSLDFIKKKYRQNI